MTGSNLERIVHEIKDVHNHPVKFESTFYDTLTRVLRSEPHKKSFLDTLQSLIDSEFQDHYDTICKKLDCGFAKKKNFATKVITVIKTELNNKIDESYTSAIYNINAPVTGAVGNHAQVVNNNFLPVENACKEANLSIEQIEKLKILFEKKDRHSMIEMIKEFGVHTASIIAGYSIMAFTK